MGFRYQFLCPDATCSTTTTIAPNWLSPLGGDQSMDRLIDHFRCWRWSDQFLHVSHINHPIPPPPQPMAIERNMHKQPKQNGRGTGSESRGLMGSAAADAQGNWSIISSGGGGGVAPSPCRNSILLLYPSPFFALLHCAFCSWEEQNLNQTWKKPQK